ncbi:MAG: hypothetical protein JWO83_105 [Caulobacteraceae bacterium]|nr:hypothetical protein [Caulobacteraceae bacterium]
MFLRVPMPPSRRVLAGLSLCVLATASAAFGAARSDGDVRINPIQVIGAHNSYHAGLTPGVAGPRPGALQPGERAERVGGRQLGERRLGPSQPESWYGRGMTDSERPLRDQLDEAIDRIRRELEILESPSSIGGGADSRSVVADLRKELRELEEARANVGPHEV